MVSDTKAALAMPDNGISRDCGLAVFRQQANPGAFEVCVGVNEPVLGSTFDDFVLSFKLPRACSGQLHGGAGEGLMSLCGLRMVRGRVAGGTGNGFAGAKGVHRWRSWIFACFPSW